MERMGMEAGGMAGMRCQAAERVPDAGLFYSSEAAGQQ